MSQLAIIVCSVRTSDGIAWMCVTAIVDRVERIGLLVYL